MVCATCQGHFCWTCLRDFYHHDDTVCANRTEEEVIINFSTLGYQTWGQTLSQSWYLGNLTEYRLALERDTINYWHVFMKIGQQVNLLSFIIHINFM